MENSRILIVDDEMIIARDIERILKNIGLREVRIANSSSEAIEIARKFKPELMLFDINLEEEKDGITTAREIQEFLNTQVIYITAHSDPAVLHEAIGTKPVNYILKPFDQEQIKVAVHVALNDEVNVGFGEMKIDLVGRLSETERKIINLIAESKTSTEIAEVLFISPKTVENNRYNICKKLKLPSEKNSLIKWVFEHKQEL